MTEQVMIYEVKNAAATNAEKLFSNDAAYFYWNETRFRNLDIGDFVFIINRAAKWVLFTRLNRTGIPTEDKGGATFFSDLDKDFIVDGTWNEFIRFEIIKKLEIPQHWQWRSLGSSETTYLNGSRISLDSAGNRLLNINQLQALTDDENILQILDNCRLNFVESKGQPTSLNPLHITPDEAYIIKAIKVKPFILLAGISGTGKSRLVRTLAYKTCNNEVLRTNPKKPGNFELIPVRPNWHDSSELIGYVSRINGEKYITTAFLRFIAKAWGNTGVPFFLCLDEMNLAPVEQYFAEYLSILETRQNQNNEIVTDFLISKANFDNPALYVQLLKDLGLQENPAFSEGIRLPANLVVIGTVNMDETTHSFSRKVLDRAMTFEMNHVDLWEGLDKTRNDLSYPVEFIPAEEVLGKFTSGAEVYNDDFKEKKEILDFLGKINTILEGTPFKIAYRVRDEFLIYCYYAGLSHTDSNWLTQALDEMISMKILSRIEGDEAKIGTTLSNLQTILTPGYERSNAKLQEMAARLQSGGYTSYWS